MQAMDEQEEGGPEDAREDESELFRWWLLGKKRTFADCKQRRDRDWRMR